MRPFPEPPHPLRTRPDLEAYIRLVCADRKLNAAAVWNSIVQRKPAGLFILAVLGVDEAVLVAHRPRELGRAHAYASALRELKEQGLDDADAIRGVAERFGLRADSVRRSLRRNPNVVADRYFEDPT